MNAKKRLYGVVETWNMGVVKKTRLNIMEMRCFRSMAGVPRLDRFREE